VDGLADWRPVQPAASPEPASAAAERRLPIAGLVTAGALGVAALAAAAFAFAAASPQPVLVLEPSSSGAAPTASAAAVELGVVVVDVQGAVVAPGLYALPAGSRVGDAVVAAGGYGAAVDIEAAAAQVNLAQPLVDGAKIVVPRLGATATAATAPPASTAPAGGGPIDLNTADAATLETLPGVGPVTAAKIIAARAEAPFASVDDLLARGVVGAATLEKIRPLATAGP
jgi:competence protein ComEA